MKKKFAIAAGILILALNMAAQTSGDVKVPAEVKPFVDAGMKAIALESADLNGDGLKDYVLVLAGKNGAGDEDDTAETRPLLILVRGKDRKLAEVKRNNSIVMCSMCGGAWGDPFAGVSVGKNTFTVRHYGGSAWRWTEDYRFNYSRIDKTWQLVKIERTSYHNVRPMKETLKTTVLTPPKDFGKIDIADFDPANFEDRSETGSLSDSSFEILDTGAINERIRNAAGAGEEWAAMPTQIAAKLAGRFSGIKSRTIEIVSEFADAAGDLTVTVIDDGIADDSIRSIKYRYILILSDRQTWQVVSAEKAQACREGRGHQEYSPAPCI